MRVEQLVPHRLPQVSVVSPQQTNLEPYTYHEHPTKERTSARIGNVPEACPAKQHATVPFVTLGLPANPARSGQLCVASGDFFRAVFGSPSLNNKS